MEIFRWWRRIRCPLEACRWPWVLPGNLAIAHGPGQVNHRQKIAQRENRGACGGKHVEYLELRRISVIAPRHAEVSEDELREEGQIETDEENHRGSPRERFRVEPPGNLGPPEVQAADVGHDCAADHDVVEVRDDEIGVVNVNVQAEAGEKETGEAADHEETNEAERINHGRIPGDGAFVERRSPVKDFYRRGNSHQVAEERKSEGCVGGLAGNKHVVGPNQKADNRNGDARARDEGVAEDGLACKSRNDLTDHAHRRENHDVHGGMGIEPEEMLEEYGIAAESGNEKDQLKHTFVAGTT